MVMDFETTTEQDDLLETLTREMERIRRSMVEIKDQVDSMRNAVDKEQGRYSGIATELRSIKLNIETVPREDIRDKYDEALDVRFRLATMRGQMEMFESNYDYLERQQTMLAQVLSQLRGYEVLPDGSPSDEGSNPDNQLDAVGIIRAQEEEKQRLARAMHDGPAQALTNFILQAEICQRLFDRSPERAAEELDNLKTNASKTFQKVREFIFDLRPMMLDDLGAVPTVRRYVESYRDKTDIDVNLELLGEERRLENYREVLVFRSIQETMGMARDYASPSAIQVKLDMSDDTIRIIIDDDGRGFDAENLFQKGEDESYVDARAEGLAMLKGKLELVGGSISVRSTDTDGTVVRMEIPTSR